MYGYATVRNALGGALVWILAWMVILIIANWKIYTKAGEKGWKSLIPYYSQYVLYRITWKTDMYWVVLIAGLGATFFSRIAIVSLTFICSIITAIVSLIQLNKMSKSFGHGIGFTLGLIFLNPIFILILAFGSSEYEGPQ